MIYKQTESTDIDVMGRVSLTILEDLTYRYDARRVTQR